MAAPSAITTVPTRAPAFGTTTAALLLSMVESSVKIMRRGVVAFATKRHSQSMVVPSRKMKPLTVVVFVAAAQPPSQVVPSPKTNL